MKANVALPLLNEYGYTRVNERRIGTVAKCADAVELKDARNVDAKSKEADYVDTASTNMDNVSIRSNEVENIDAELHIAEYKSAESKIKSTSANEEG